MLLHVIPALYASTRCGEGRRLVDIAIPEIGVTLREGRELMARTPFPNKRWLHACAKGRKAQMGVLLDVGDPPDAFTLVTRWAVEAAAVLVHEVRLELADRRHEVIAACAWDWSMFGADGWRWESVRLPWMTVRHSMGLDARMDETPRVRDVVRPAEDTIAGGLVVRRRETMPVPTIERERYDWIAEQTSWSRSTPHMPTAPIRIGVS